MLKAASARPGEAKNGGLASLDATGRNSPAPRNSPSMKAPKITSPGAKQRSE
jgi:hypothetical protein